MTERIETCALCPRLCRPACPVAVGTAREAATPSAIAIVLVDHQRGLATSDEARSAATLCVDCGACQEHCHLHQPLPALLREARRDLVSLGPLPPLEAPEPGPGDIVLEPDDRPVARWLAAHLGRPTRRWRGRDDLGAAWIGTPEWEARARSLREHTRHASTVWVASGGAAQAMDAAGVPYSWVSELVRGDVVASCRAAGAEPGGLACCGAAGPLGTHHAADAARVAEAWHRRTRHGILADARCRNHLRACGLDVTDAIDALAPAPEAR